MIKKLYLFISYVLIFIITLSVILTLIISHPKTLEYLGEKFLKPNGVTYSKIEGSLLEGIILEDVEYLEAASVKRLQVKYNLLLLLQPTPTISNVIVTNLTLNPKNFPKTDENAQSEFSIPTFKISKLSLEKTKVLLEGETLEFTLKASGLYYKNKVNVKKIALDLSTSYGKVKLDAKIEANHLFGTSLLTPKQSISEKYLSFLEGMPKEYALTLDANMQRVIITTTLENLALSAEQNLSLSSNSVTLSYFIEENYFTAESSSLLAYGEFEAEVKQKTLFKTSGSYETKLNAMLLKQPIELPFKKLSAELYGDIKGVRATLKAGSLELDVVAKEYKEFIIHARSDKFPLSFISALPEELRSDVFSFKADATLDVSPFSLKGALSAEDLYANITASFEMDESSKLLQTKLTPKLDTLKAYPIEKFSPVNLVYYENAQKRILNADANMLNLTLFEKNEVVEGWGNVGASFFEAEGNLQEQKEINFSALIPSIKSVLDEFMPKASTDAPLFDAKVEINANLNLSEKISLSSTIHMPWLYIKVDEQTTHTANDIYIKSTFSENELTIQEYTMRILDNNIYSKKASHISLDENQTLNFKEFWIFDNLLLSGSYNLPKEEGELKLKSEHFSYDSKDANVTLKADITASFESNATQKIEGSVTLLEGLISYEPSANYAISDDIIIIQDIRPASKVKRSVNIQINSAKPLTYKTKSVDIKVMPDLVVTQEPNAPLRVYGVLGIEEGTVTGAGKVFEFEKSEIFFTGASPINPHLNLNLHYYTLDDVDIEIFITNTLASPVIIFSSTPQMSQNDIMSYILFGEPASADFDSSGEPSSKLAMSSVLLATGLKEIFNDTSGLNVDTLNIITNKEGTLGYEIGTRFNKQVRVVYKNDTISSIIIQYSLSKSVRIDVDVRETGQGVTILYVKDF